MHITLQTLTIDTLLTPGRRYTLQTLH